MVANRATVKLNITVNGFVARHYMFGQRALTASTYWYILSCTRVLRVAHRNNIICIRGACIMYMCVYQCIWTSNTR